MSILKCMVEWSRELYLNPSSYVAINSGIMGKLLKLIMGICSGTSTHSGYSSTEIWIELEFGNVGS